MKYKFSIRSVNFVIVGMALLLNLSCHKEMFERNRDDGYSHYNEDRAYHFRYVNSTDNNISVTGFSSGNWLLSVYVPKRSVAVTHAYYDVYGQYWDFGGSNGLVFEVNYYANFCDSVVININGLQKSLTYLPDKSATEKNILNSAWEYNIGSTVHLQSKSASDRVDSDHVYTCEFTQEHIDSAQ